MKYTFTTIRNTPRVIDFYGLAAGFLFSEHFDKWQSFEWRMEDALRLYLESGLKLKAPTAKEFNHLVNAMIAFCCGADPHPYLNQSPNEAYKQYFIEIAAYTFGQMKLNKVPII